ncbi:restriction endonuclease subunit S [Chryseobacterium sp. MDT2-18]|uniref:restriction endonuclease subunit S n=1 Tax=Chryseobacterium sp. MDT2-18 TaxID=1259136 RepID=UPI002789123A|nr:restriction endonuclease subunit S [Chryseobacterium sp. MDT2-18]MDQ0478149.1 type I restriction enzyme S subunit [Chryseobacterium sp. MDT2-18]
MERVKLIDICNPKQWKTISGNEILKEGKYPVYGANGKIGFYDKFTHEFPTVLITCRGATCGSINISEPKSYVNGNAMALDNLVNDYDLNYLVYVLKQRGFQDVISGSAQPQITRQGLFNVEVPKPSLSTQKNIAAKLDKAQEIISYNKQLLEKYDQLTQSLFIDMFGDPVKNEKGWGKVKLGEILDFMTSGSRGWAKYYSEIGDVFLRIQNVGYNKLKLNEIGYVNAPSNAEAKRTRVKENDIVLSITADLGRTAVIPKDFPDAFINQHLAILRVNNQFNPNFVSAYIASKGGQLMFNKLDKGGVKAGLNFADIRSYEIFLLSTTLQNQFAERSEKIEIQKQMAQETLAKSEHLFQSLLKESFR